jgi:hypothetical protein
MSKINIYEHKKEEFKMVDLLTEEIKSKMEEVSGLQIGTMEYEWAVTDINTLTKSVAELEKLEVEKLEKINQSKQDELKLEQMKQQFDLQKRQVDLQEQQHKAQVRNNTIQALTIVGTTLLTAAITIWGTNTTLEFEKEGTVTTSAGKSFLNRLFTRR